MSKTRPLVLSIVSLAVAATLGTTIVQADSGPTSLAAVAHERALTAGSHFSDGNFASRVGRWMDSRVSQSLQSFSVTSALGDGTDNWFELRHSQTDVVDKDLWNPEATLSKSTEFALSQRTGQIWWHASGAHTPGETSIHVGAEVGAFGLNVGSGDGDTHVRLGGNMNDLNPWFFHGGRRLPFQFSGVTATWNYSPSSTLELGQWRFDMQGQDSRQTRFVGLRGQSMYGRFYDVSTGRGVGTGNGLELGWRGRNLGMGFREVRDQAGASTRSLSFSTGAWDRANVTLSFQHDRNPTFDVLDDTRVMLSFSGRLGGNNTLVMRAGAEQTEEEQEAQAKANRGRNIALIGGGAVLLAAAAGGGGGSDGPSNNGARFQRERGAAFSVLNGVNPRCVSENREYGGWVFRNADGTFSHINPIRGETASVNIGSPRTAVPSGTVATASYHCHAGPDPRFDNENFSPQDLFSDRFNNVNGYLATPGGLFKKHDVRTDAITTLGTVRIR